MQLAKKQHIASFPHVIYFVFVTDDTVQHHTAYTLEQQLKTRYEKPKWSGNVLLACHDTTTEFIVYNAYKNKKVTSLKLPFKSFTAEPFHDNRILAFDDRSIIHVCDLWKQTHHKVLDLQGQMIIQKCLPLRNGITVIITAGLSVFFFENWKQVATKYYESLVDLIELSDGTIATLERVAPQAQIVIWDNTLTTRHVVTHVQSNNLYIKQMDQYTVCLYYTNLTEFIDLRDHSHKYVEQCHSVWKLKKGYMYGGKAQKV
jgi:hypothetical protein